jgi:hypothetical protein
MRDWQGQSHVKWYCKYHVVFVSKLEIVEGHAMADHIHLCLTIPSKCHPRFLIDGVLAYERLCDSAEQVRYHSTVNGIIEALENGWPQFRPLGRQGFSDRWGQVKDGGSV